MTTLNWVELIVLIVIVVAGALIYRYVHARVDDADGLGGINEADRNEGTSVGDNRD